MRSNLTYLSAVIIGVFISACSSPIKETEVVLPIPEFRMPNNYLCYQAPEAIVTDGKITPGEWKDAPWSEWFRDIEGASKPEPRFKTRMKMLWDENYLYVAAELEEPHVWAKIVERDAVIFYDNDFEVFIDPDDDTHAYYELEINAFGTAWDLMLLQPYRDGGPAIDSWDISGLKVGVDINGTINDPGDIDVGWTLEIAIPMSVLEECAPGGSIPSLGDRWRINFSRVEWKVDIKEGNYEKTINPETGKPYPEDNWVWSPQGYINMHMPEYWGYVQFEGKAENSSGSSFNKPADLEARWILRNLYYRQFEYGEENGKYAASLDELNWPSDSLKDSSYEVIMRSGLYGYEAFIDLPEEEGVIVINEKGLIKKH